MKYYDSNVEPILGFSGKNRFLSNFYPVTFTVESVIYKSSEHYYMSCKTDDENARSRIISCETPSEAKKLGRSITLRNQWEENYRDKSMMTGLRHKFEVPEMKKLLINTGTAYLEETNHWNDTYWVYAMAGAKIC